MDWFPFVFGTIKGLVLLTGMFFAVKWHYDQGKKEKPMETRAVVRAGGAVAAVFVLALLGLGYATLAFGRMLGMDLTL